MGFIKQVYEAAPTQNTFLKILNLWRSLVKEGCMQAKRRGLLTAPILVGRRRSHVHRTHIESAAGEHVRALNFAKRAAAGRAENRTDGQLI